MMCGDVSVPGHKERKDEKGESKGERKGQRRVREGICMWDTRGEWDKKERGKGWEGQERKKEKRRREWREAGGQGE